MAPRNKRKTVPEVKDLIKKVKGNKYNPLSPNDDEEDDYMSDSTVVSEDTKEKISEVIPPIVLKSPIENVKLFHNELKQIVTNVELRSFYQTKQIFTHNYEDSKKVKEFLKKKGCEFYSYTHKSEAYKKLVLKGVDKSITADEVLADLKEQVPNGIAQVKQMTMRPKEPPGAAGNSKQKIPMNAFVVYVNPGTKLVEVRQKVKIVVFHRIIWESYHKKRPVLATFCYRCSRWGHSDVNCGMNKRCPLCSSTEHSVDTCSMKNNSANLKPKCPNCDGEHIASSKDCESYKKYIEKRSDNNNKRTKQQNMQKKANSSNTGRKNTTQNEPPREEVNLQSDEPMSGYRSDVTYAAVVSPNNQRTPPQQTTATADPPDDSFLESEISTLFNIPMEDFINKIKDFMPKYQTKEGKIEKQIALIGLICDLCK